jgi:hypothetical protein
MKTTSAVSLLVFVLFLAACGSSGSASPTAVPSVASATEPSGPNTVVIEQGTNRATVTVEIAATFAQREVGLMNRHEMAEDAGMLFLFGKDVRYGFWMKNTYIPLDIAYISGTGEVVDVIAAKPLDETALVPAKSYQYVLEVNQGWFQRHSLGIGAMVTVPKDLPPAE